jgi:predicted ATPase/DNA-binding SARP family transcriptional activator
VKIGRARSEEIVATTVRGEVEASPFEGRIQLLGEIRACVGGEPVDVGPPKCQALLAALALSPGATVPVARLVELVWGESPPRTAAKTLQSYVVRLRRELGAERVERVGAGYRLLVPVDSVDVVRFQRLLDEGDVEGALTEWAGPPLAGLEVDGMTPVVNGLVEQWVGATETRLARQVDQDPRGAIAPLTELTARHPFREGLWLLLMTALYRVDRQADALAAYRTAREHLVSELGVEPGPRLRDLETRILEQDAGLGEVAARETRAGREDRAGAVATTDPPPRTVPSQRGAIPQRLGRLVGRTRELGDVDRALAAHSVVTLVGPGGIGKTRLALAAAEAAAPRFTGGACLVDLATVSTPGDVTRAVADVLGARETTTRTLAQSVLAALQRRGLLLLLDNCEHVVEGAARLSHDVAEACPDVTVLATSREPLGVAHERVAAVAPLDGGSAAELFVERAAAVDPLFDPGASRSEVVDICRRLDGVPLAIELAAARTRTMTPEQIRDRLDDRLGLLTGGRRDRVERHRTLRATIRWSVDLLTAEERQLFSRISVFAGPFDLVAAEKVAADAGLGVVAVDDLIGALVDRSMLIVESGPFGRQLRLLETMRQYGAEMLAHEGSTVRMAERHARWCLGEVETIHRQLAGHDEVAGVRRLAGLWPNLRSAVDAACARGDAGLVVSLVEPIVGEVLLRSNQEIGDWAERVLALATPEEPDFLVFGLVWAAHRYALSHDRDAYERLATRHGEPDDPLVRHARAFLHEDWSALLELAPSAMRERRRRDQPFLAELMETDVVTALLNLGRFAELDAVAEPLARRYRADGPPTLLNWTLMLQGYAASFQGRHQEAEALFAAGVAVAVPPRTHTPNGAIEARVAFRSGDRRRAFHLLRSHLDELLETDNMQGVCIAGVEFVNMMLALDRLVDVARMLDYLETTQLLDSPSFRGLVADASTATGHRPGAPAASEGGEIDDRGAAVDMRHVLDDLLDGAEAQVS